MDEWLVVFLLELLQGQLVVSVLEFILAEVNAPNHEIAAVVDAHGVPFLGQRVKMKPGMDERCFWFFLPENDLNLSEEYLGLVHNIALQLLVL